MGDKELALKQITDDIIAGFIDDPLEDYKYLKEEIAKYKDHELYEDINKSFSSSLFIGIPNKIREGLRSWESLTEDTINGFNYMICEAEQYMMQKEWGISASILRSLIGDGIPSYDNEQIEYRSLEDIVQIELYNKFFKNVKEIQQTPINFGRLYGLYGCALFEFKQIDDARNMLQTSLHFNPLNSFFFFEYVETFKVTRDFATFEKLSRDFFAYAYSMADIGHLYRNLGYAYVEKKEYEVATALLYYSLGYDPNNKIAEGELEYIKQLTGDSINIPNQEAANAILNREQIQIGVSQKVIQLLYNCAYIESHMHHDVKKTEYFCKYLYDVTRNEQLVNELLDFVKKAPEPVSTPVYTEEPSIYDKYKNRSLKEVFPDYPQITECRLRIEFTINSSKYEATIRQILTHIDDMAKEVSGKDVTLFFADVNSIVNNYPYIIDVYAIANSWKSFKITLNGHPRNITEFKYFLSFLEDINKGLVTKWQKPEDLRKKYNKEVAPKRVKKAKPEDGVFVDLTGCNPQEIIYGIAMTYIQIYLNEFEIKQYKISDNEIVLYANDDLVVDFWVTSKGTYQIQELTNNNLFKYNATAFRNIFYVYVERNNYVEPMPERIALQFKKYDRSYIPEPELDRYDFVKKAIPELKLGG